MASDDLIRLMQCLFLPAADTFREVLWHPAVDIHRTPYGWLVKFELAGVQPEDIDLLAQGQRLTVRGLRRDCMTEEEHRCYLMEITYNHFERTVELPCNLDQADISTDYKHGLLLVRIQTEAQA
jgi:HSP20 family protein